MFNYNLVKKGLALPIVLIIVAVVLVTGATATGVYLVAQNQQNERNNPSNVSNSTPVPTSDVVSKIDNTDNDNTPSPTSTPTSSDTIETTQTATSTPSPTVQPTQIITATPQSTQIITPTSTPTKKPTRYTDPPKPGGFNPINTELQVTATRLSNGVRLTWTKCNSDQFVAYKVARSETATDVYFPRDGSIASINNVNTLSYTDTTVNPGTTYYYRICSLESDGSSWCGNVVKISY